MCFQSQALIKLNLDNRVVAGPGLLTDLASSVIGGSVVVASRGLLGATWLSGISRAGDTTRNRVRAAVGAVRRRAVSRRAVSRRAVCGSPVT